MDDVHDDAMVFAVTAPVDLPGDFGSRILLQMVTVRPSLEARYPPLWAGTVLRYGPAATRRTVDLMYRRTRAGIRAAASWWEPRSC